MVIVPGLTHLAVLAINLISKNHRVAVVDNGLCKKEREILKKYLPNVSVFKLKTNRLFGKQMTDTHPEVIETLAYLPEGKLIFIDPDCYIFDDKIIDSLIDELDFHLFASPFCFINEELEEIIPETFLLGINTAKLRKIKKVHGVKFGESSLPMKLKSLVWKKWKTNNPWPQPYKKLYDTIHIPLLAGFVENMTVGQINFDNNSLFHVCGTSYNQNSYQSKKENDFLIINAHYFHLRVIEILNFEWLREYFKKLICHYGSSKKLTRDFEEYSKSELRINIDKLISKISKHSNSILINNA
jgi:hypothetical protein